MDTALVSTTTTNAQTFSKTDQKQQPRAPSSNPSFPNSVISLLDLSSSSQNQNSSSDEEDEGGDDQDEESDSTECSSSDNEENASPQHVCPTSKCSSFNGGAHAVTNVGGVREPLHPISPNNSGALCKEPVRSRCVDLRQALWPTDRPVPLPAWACMEPAVVSFKDILDYEEFAGCIELISQQTVAAHKYNTVENYIRLVTKLYFAFECSF